MGGLLGAVLTRAGHEVTYVARDPAALTSISVRSGQFGDFTVPARAVARLAEPVDLCLLTVKATGLRDAITGLPGQGLVLPLLNGVEHMAVLREHFPPEQVFAGAIRVESTRVASGQIEHTSAFSAIEVASDTAPPQQVEALAEQLRGAGFDVATRPSEAAVLWGKLAFLAPFALLTTHAAGPAGVVRDERRADLEAVVNEVAAVAKADGAPVDPAAVLAMFDRMPGGMRSTMQRDVAAGRPTELDAIGGAVLRAAARHGMDTPVTARLVAELAA